ncbi:hypothetical protein BC829DRAFT_399814, partial [Chytridium lagenaria]
MLASTTTLPSSAPAAASSSSDVGSSPQLSILISTATLPASSSSSYSKQQQPHAIISSSPEDEVPPLTPDTNDDDSASSFSSSSSSVRGTSPASSLSSSSSSKRLSKRRSSVSFREIVVVGYTHPKAEYDRSSTSVAPLTPHERTTDELYRSAALRTLMIAKQAVSSSSNVQQHQYPAAPSAMSHAMMHRHHQVQELRSSLMDADFNVSSPIDDASVVMSVVDSVLYSSSPRLNDPTLSASYSRQSPIFNPYSANAAPSFEDAYSGPQHSANFWKCDSSDYTQHNTATALQQAAAWQSSVPSVPVATPPQHHIVYGKNSRNSRVMAQNAPMNVSFGGMVTIPPFSNVPATTQPSLNRNGYGSFNKAQSQQQPRHGHSRLPTPPVGSGPSSIPVHQSSPVSAPTFQPHLYHMQSQSYSRQQMSQGYPDTTTTYGAAGLRYGAVGTQYGSANNPQATMWNQAGGYPQPQQQQHMAYGVQRGTKNTGHLSFQQQQQRVGSGSFYGNMSLSAAQELMGGNAFGSMPRNVPVDL